MDENKHLPLFWYSLYKFNPSPAVFSKHWFRKIADKEKENYGDLISKYLYRKITGVKPQWYNPLKLSTAHNFLAVGSVLNFANSKSIIWGSGIINTEHEVSNCDFRAVRGPATRRRLLELGYECPEIYGDPSILLPEFYSPTIKRKYDIGIIPHFYDFKIALEAVKNPNVKIIKLLTNDVEKTTKEILSCNKIISSSLHGIIVAHAYGIPAVWVRFSNKLKGDGIKFQDYFSSVGIEPYQGELWKGTGGSEALNTIFSNYPNLPEEKLIKELKEGLLLSCPFKS